MRSRLPEQIRDAVQLVEGGHEVTDELMAAREYVDLLIPRGGAGLINAVVTGSKVPVIQTGTGNCHLVIDAVSYTHLTLPTTLHECRSRWSPYH